MTGLHLSSEQYKTLARILRHHLGYDFLATQASVAAYKNMYATEAVWHSYPSAISVVDPDAHVFWVKNSLEVLVNRLGSDRDHNLPCAAGVTCVNRQNPHAVVRSIYISVVIACDGGGGSFKVTSTIALRESDKA
jgi:hypothetical protein